MGMLLRLDTGPVESIRRISRHQENLSCGTDAWYQRIQNDRRSWDTSRHFVGSNRAVLTRCWPPACALQAEGQGFESPCLHQPSHFVLTLASQTLAPRLYPKFHIIWIVTYVYILRSIAAPDQTYVGCTTDLKARLTTHNEGGSAHTAKYRPWELVIFVRFEDDSKAWEFERYLKSGSGRAFAKKHFL